MSEEGTTQTTATVVLHPDSLPHCGEVDGCTPCLLLAEHQTKCPSQDDSTVPAVGSMASPALCSPRAPRLMAPQVLPVATTLPTLSHHLQHLVLLPAPPWCPGAPCPHLHQQARQGALPPHPHHAVFPRTYPMHGAAGGSTRHRNRAPSPALVAVLALRIGPAGPKQSGQGLPLPLQLLEEPGAKGTRAWDKASGTPQLHQVPGTGCCPAKPSAPNPAHPAAVLPSLPTLCGAGRTGSVGLAGTGSCQAPGPGSTAEAGSVPPGWLRVARLRRHAPTMGTPGSTHSTGTRWPCTVGLAGSPSAAAFLHQGAAPARHRLSLT